MKKQEGYKGIESAFLFRLFFLVCFFSLGCTRPAPLLKVGPHAWTAKEFKKELVLYMKALPVGVPAMDSDFIKKTVLEDLILRSVLEIWAKKYVKPYPDSFPSLLKKREFLLKHLEEHLQSSADPGNLKSFYEKHKKSFYDPDKCLFEQILLPKENLARALERRLLQGESFENLLQIYAPASKIHPVWIAKGTLKVFDEACDTLTPGAVSAPLKSAYGFHILKLKAKKPGRQKSFKEMKDYILKEMKTELQAAAFQKWLQKNLQSSSVFINEELMQSLHIGYKKRLL